MELYEEDEERFLAAADLQSELDDLPRPALAVVAYHLQVLRGTGLLPGVEGASHQ